MKSSSIKDTKKETPKATVKVEEPKPKKQEPPKQTNPHGSGLQQPL